MAVLIVALLTAAAVAAASLAGANRPSDPTDLEVPDGWLVVAVSRWPVVRAVTELRGTPTLLVLMTVVGLVEWHRRADASSLWFLLAVAVGVAAVNNALELAIMRERPPVERLMDAAGSSFPSGHSAAAAACWPALALVVGRWDIRRRAEAHHGQ